MTVEDRYDVVIAGGGLAGLCLAIQLKRARSSIQRIESICTRRISDWRANRSSISSMVAR